MKKPYNKPILDVMETSLESRIALDLSNGTNNGIIDFIQNPGQGTGWDDFMN